MERQRYCEGGPHVRPCCCLAAAWPRGRATLHRNGVEERAVADERVAGWQERRAVAERARRRALARGDARLAEGLVAVVAGYDRWLARPEEGGLPSVPALQPSVCSL